MVNIGEDQQTHLYVLQSHRQFNGGFRPSDKGAHPDPDISSLRSKRFQSSYSAKFGAGAKKKWKGEGEGRRGNVPSLPSPSPFIPFFALVPVFFTNSRGTAYYAGYDIREAGRSHVRRDSP